MNIILFLPRSFPRYLTRDFIFARLISGAITPRYRMISLPRYVTELSPGILARVSARKRASSQSRRNIGRVISISAICSCRRVRGAECVPYRVWAAQTNRAVCGFARVCVVGAERIRSRSFDPPGMRLTSRPE